MKESAESIAIVGSGISGATTAIHLSEAGHSVALYSKGPDPRETSDLPHFSSTHDGELGRFITPFEGHPYLGSTPMYPDMNNAFSTPISEGGWLSAPRSSFSQDDRKWLDERAKANWQNVSENYRTYVTLNRESMKLWEDWFDTKPYLFEGTDLRRDGILRIYDNEPLLEWSIELHKREDVLEQALFATELAEQYPTFCEACEKGAIAGGLETRGFTLNIKRLVENILDELEAQGAKLCWNVEIQKILLSDQKVIGLQSNIGIIKHHCYSLHTGAYGAPELLSNTPAKNKIAGVLGRWLLMPQPAGMKKPVKIHGEARSENGKRYPVVDINLTPFHEPQTGETWLAVGGGYSFVGSFPFRIDPSMTALVDREIEKALKKFFGTLFDQAAQKGLVRRSNATCVRSFTPNDMPLNITLPTQSGGALTIEGGTNTGTTTVAPSIARTVLQRVTRSSNSTPTEVSV